MGDVGCGGTIYTGHLLCGFFRDEVKVFLIERGFGSSLDCIGWSKPQIKASGAKSPANNPEQPCTTKQPAENTTLPHHSPDCIQESRRGEQKNPTDAHHVKASDHKNKLHQQHTV